MWHTLKDADGSGVVVDTSCSAESGREDRGGGDQVVGKGVVQVALGGGGVSVSLAAEVGGRGEGTSYLELENILDGVEFLLVPVRAQCMLGFWSLRRCGGSCRPGQRADMLKHHVMASASWHLGC